MWKVKLLRDLIAWHQFHLKSNLTTLYLHILRFHVKNEWAQWISISRITSEVQFIACLLIVSTSFWKSMKHWSLSAILLNLPINKDHIFLPRYIRKIVYFVYNSTYIHDDCDSISNNTIAWLILKYGQSGFGFLLLLRTYTICWTCSNFGRLLHSVIQ